MAQARTVRGGKKSPSSKWKKRPGSSSKNLSQDCRCKCSGVCSITGRDSIAAGGRTTYRLQVRIARNLGCRAATSGCEHTATTWTKGGPRAGAVTLRDQDKNSVGVTVDRGTAAGTFWLQAQPETSCDCKGPGNIVVDCTDQNEQVTINVT